MKDIILKEGAPVIANGDFVIDYSANQHIESIVHAHKGNNREFPSLGFGVSRFIKGKADPKRFTKELKVELESDGFKNCKISVDEKYNLEIEV